MKPFKPMLAPNEEVDIMTIQYPLLASHKLDGIRCIFMKGKLLSRSLKPIQNKQLKEKLEPIRAYSESTNLIFDGEIYSPDLTFQEITSFVMTEDFTDPKTVKKNDGEIIQIPEHLKFYIFDLLQEGHNYPFNERISQASFIADKFEDICELVKHNIATNPESIKFSFEDALESGCEGLILRNPNGHYKFGRGTIKEGLIYKLKPFVTFDSQITGVVQSTEVNETAVKKINELGRSVTSKKKDDRHLIEKASAFWVNYQDKPLKVTLAMSDIEKEEVWKQRDSLIGRWVEYKGMQIGAKDVPRHPVFVRYREDKKDE